MNTTSSGCYVIDDNYNIVNMNEVAKTLYPDLKIGEKCYKCLMDLNEPCGPCPVAAGRKGPCTYVDPIRKIRETVDALDITIEPYGLCHALVFSTVGVSEEYAASLPVSGDELTDLGIIRALTFDYADVFNVNMKEDIVTVLRLNNHPLDAKDVRRHMSSYQDRITDYCAKYVVEEDKAVFLEQNSLPYIKQKLSETDHIENFYRVLYKDEIHYFCRKISRIGDAESFHTVIIGGICLDDNIREQKRVLELEKHLEVVQYDAKVSLFNREAFIINSTRLLENHPDESFDFCICRLDNLNLINHQYGKTMGDKVLAVIGKELSLRTEENNSIGYLGDGVFASFTPNDPRDIREAAVNAFRDELLCQSEIKGLSLKWSIYTEVNRELSIEAIIEKTVYALNIVRKSIHQDYIEFDQSMIERMELEQKINLHFDSCLKAGEFIPYYQPKYSIKTGRIVGAEALVRWIRPDGIVVPPGMFIPVLEESGKINRLDEEISRQVCCLKAAMAENSIEDLPISVNLSRASLFKNDLPARYSKIADAYSLDKGNIPIEITESAAVRMASIKVFADSLLENGFSLHMDDFGAGYSSLASLQTIPFDCIKIDKQLIDNIGTDDGENLLKHTVAFAKESGKTVVAEGVERYEQLLFLKVIGCDMIQGFYYSKPLPEQDFLKLLREDHAEADED